ncbi:NUDIX domain-containing protein [Kineococcus endophyticus]|uniref:NUDIX domain-containing protein n=1 Tax=Kineococcus endophyticus TaxID=1181883 RepID=A0ABV3PCR2_9ACTN
MNDPAPEAAGVQVILLDPQDRVLLQLRDDTPGIPYPGTWCLPGGHLEEDEDPVAAAVRELREEMSLEIASSALHHVVSVRRHYGVEHTYWTHLDVEAERLPLTEGQSVRFHALAQVRLLRLGYEDNAVLEEFFARRGRT